MEVAQGLAEAVAGHLLKMLAQLPAHLAPLAGEAGRVAQAMPLLVSGLSNASSGRAVALDVPGASSVRAISAPKNEELASRPQIDLVE